jgi:predicted molibdopterin-dependent oxidoreductase YjgC
MSWHKCYPCFRSVHEVGEETLVIDIDGHFCAVDARWTVAAALVAHGHVACRHTAAGPPRGPFCLSGVCFECLVTIDGIPHRQACLTPVAQGMKIVLGRTPEARS